MAFSEISDPDAFAGVWILVVCEVRAHIHGEKGASATEIRYDGL